MARILAALILSTTIPVAASAAVISDGNVMLGIKDSGALNDNGAGIPSPVTGTSSVGLRYTPTGNESTSHGCDCEGWGVGIADSDGNQVATGYDGNGFFNLTSIPIVATATTATTVATLTSGELRVTHDFALAEETDELFRVKVTIENLSGFDIADLRYTRVMDWDIEPTTFSEFSTIQGTAAATNVLFAHDDGFESADPFGSRSAILDTGDFVDSGPTDHGALFDFGFGALVAGESFSFDIFYGGAATETDALIALNAVGAEVYSLGQAANDPLGLGLLDGDNPTNTFIFGFAGVGGVVVPDPTDPSPIPLPAGGLLLIGGLAALAGLRRRKA